MIVECDGEARAGCGVVISFFHSELKQSRRRANANYPRSRAGNSISNINVCPEDI